MGFLAVVKVRGSAFVAEPEEEGEGKGEGKEKGRTYSQARLVFPPTAPTTALQLLLLAFDPLGASLTFFRACWSVQRSRERGSDEEEVGFEPRVEAGVVGLFWGVAGGGEGGGLAGRGRGGVS